MRGKIELNTFNPKWFVIVAVTVLAVCVLLMTTGTELARAAFPGDNGKIAFTSARDGNPEIYTANPDGTGLARLTNNSTGDQDPVFSADGKKIAFVSYRDGNAEIYAMNADGSSQVRITNNSYPDTQPTWAPNGQKIAFTAQPGVDQDVHVINADRSGETDLSRDGSTFNSDDRDPAWSPDGQEIAFSTPVCPSGGTHCSREIVLMTPNGEFIERVTYSSSPTKVCESQEPAWSPNGLLAWASTCGTQDYGLEIYAQGSNQWGQPVRLTFNNDQDYAPAWSPDGSKIAFHGFRAFSGGGSTSKIFLVNANGGSPEAVLANSVSGDRLPDWQPTDKTPPNTTITSGPSGAVDSASASFSFSSSEAGSTFHCSLDGAAFSACTSPTSYSNLSDGQHTFQVKATDSAGNTDATPASSTWTVDTRAPAITITTPADGATYDLNQAVNADYSCADGAGGSGVASCQGTVDNGSPVDTASPGAKTFTVTTTDDAGNQGSITHPYTVSEYTETGTSGNDVLLGTEGSDVIYGGGGNDTIKGGGGNDTLIGGVGSDKLYGGEGDDSFDGGLGNDTANFSGSASAITASLSSGTASGEGSDTFVGMESLVGSVLGDGLNGSNSKNSLNGGGGADTLSGQDGADKLKGGGGNDTMHGDLGNDSVVGSGGADAHSGDEGDDSLNSQDGKTGNDSVDGGADTDTCVTDNAERSISNCE